jgi:short-subunit dehydrogenase
MLKYFMKKIVLVTGASSALGKNIVEHLIEEGDVVYAGSRNVKKLSSNKKLHPLKLDITSDTDVNKAIAKIISEQKRIDILINCAGETLAGPTEEFTSEDYIKLLEVNTVGSFRLMKAIIPYMKKQKSGSIISITSMSGLVSFPNFGLYSSSKFALEALSESFYYELKKYAINVTTIAPGAIYNPTIDISKMPHKPAREKFLILKVLLPMVTIEEITHTVLDTIKSKNPRSRIVLGRDAKLVHTMNRILPHHLWNLLMSYVWQKH